MIIAVTGSRDADARLHRPRIETVIRWLAGDHPLEGIWHGGARGVDEIADAVALDLGVPPRRFPADWSGPCQPQCRPGHRGIRKGVAYCPAAGVYRNQEMINALWTRLTNPEQPDTKAAVLAFPLIGAGNRGTTDCRERSIRTGIPTLVFPLEPGV